MLNCPSPKHTQQHSVFELPDLRFYPVALKMEVPDERDPMRKSTMFFHKVTGPSVPRTLKEAGLVTSLAALFGHLQLMRGSLCVLREGEVRVRGSRPGW